MIVPREESQEEANDFLKFFLSLRMDLFGSIVVVLRSRKRSARMFVCCCQNRRRLFQQEEEGFVGPLCFFLSVLADIIIRSRRAGEEVFFDVVVGWLGR